MTLLWGLSTKVWAADISALNFNGDLIGKVIPDGAVVNFNNELIGHITADGLVYDDRNDIIGGIVPQGIAISYDNSILGKVGNDGSVTADNDALVGKVLPNGLVVNDNYDILGAVISPGLVYNDAGKIIGRVSGDGKYYSLVGENIGYVTASGYVYTTSRTEQKLNLAGKLITSKIVVSPAGKYLGSIAPDGKVIDNKKAVIGNIHANGFVYAPDGKIIGQTVESGYAFDLSGKYIGIVSYNGEVLNKGKAVAHAVNGNRVINKDGKIIGFTVSMSATANTLDGKYLGRITSEGKIVRGRNQIGMIGASGNVIDTMGAVIGVINTEGPVFDYLGELRANAAVGGHIVSLDGVELGKVIKDDAFDVNGNKIGKTMSPRLNFNNANEFIGISGINSVLPFNGKVYKTSPYGYVYDETATLNGRSFPFGPILTADGNILSYTTGNGITEDASLNEIAKLTGAGFFLDKNNKLLGKTMDDKYVTNFTGETLGYLTPVYHVVNMRNQEIGKVLPDSNVIELSGKTRQNYGRAGNASMGISINGDYLGTNLINGQVVKGMENIGKISSNGNILDNMGALYGNAMSMGAVVSPQCEFLGVVSDNGEARTAKGAYLGMILANGQVVSETENVIGHVIKPMAANGKGGSLLGTLNPLGNVLNYANQTLGCADSEGLIRNAQKEIIGRVISYMSIMDYNNKIIGYTDFNGNVVDVFGIQQAIYDIDGNIVSKNGKNIGVPFNYKVAFDANNVYLGRVTPEGKVVSDGGEVLGTVGYNGEVFIPQNKNGYALYDLYVYDNDGKTIGYIAKNGRVYSIMGEMQGTIYNGFVLDKKQKLIGRGARDYNIRNAEKTVIGHLRLDGAVLNTKNVEIGQLQSDGKIINTDGNVIATAERLQYHQRPSEHEPKKEEKNVVKEERYSKTSDEKITEIKQDTEIPQQEKIPEMTAEEKEAEETRNTHKVVGIAVTPGGNYIGDVYSNNKVISEDGVIVGGINENGEVIDVDGNEVGTVQESETQSKGGNRRDWHRFIAAGTTVDPYSSGNEVTFVGPGGGIGPGGRYNPQRAAILSQLQDERRKTMGAAVIKPGYNAASYTGWQDDWGLNRSVSTLRVNMDNVITADKPIPAVLARSLISLGEAPVTAIVERNVYGDSGRNVIIPAGSRIIGGMDDSDGTSRFDNSSGGVKLEISWYRIIRPDGIAFILDGGRSTTGDAQGRGGGALGYVDEQLVKKYTLPIVGTLVSSAITYMMAADEDSTGEVETSKQQAASDARQQFMDKMDQILQEIIDSKSQIEAVTYVPAGTRIIIYPMRDLWLRSTKDIEKGVDTALYGTGVGGLVTEKVVGEGGAGNGGTTTSVQSGNGGSQKVILGGTQAQVNNENQATPLISSSSSEKQNTTAGKKNIGALPPPAADGTVMETPASEEELSSDGDIELMY